MSAAEAVVMFARTPTLAFPVLAALALANLVACQDGAEPAVSRLDPRAVEDAPPAEQGGEKDVASPSLPDEEPLTGMPVDDTMPRKDDSEARPAMRACDVAKPFGALTAMPWNTSAYETGGRFSADELTFYFARKTSTAGMQPYAVTRASKDAAWAAPAVLATVASTSDDGYFTTTTDELVGFFASARSGNLQIHRTTRATKSDAWGAITVASSLASTSAEDDPFVIASGRAIYFDSNRSGTWSIYRASIEEDGSIGAPSSVTTGTNAVITGDELTMYFSRTNGTQQDIHLATRAAANDAWNAPTNVTELNSASDDRVTWVSPDGCRVIVSSTRAGGAGSSDLYFAQKPE